MMNSSNQTYKELALPFFKETFDCIDEVMLALHLPYYLIGVSALSLELLKQGIKPSRGTKDIDFAVMISCTEDYNQIIAALETKGFNKLPAPHTFYSETFKVAVDVLPFGEIQENHTSNFDQRTTELHLLGFKEVLQHPQQVAIEDKIANIPPLEGMVILKLIAWSDRPEERENDLSDILLIIQHYYNLKWNEIVERHFDTLTHETFDHLYIAAEVLGRNTRVYLHKSTAITSRVLQVLNANLNEPLKSAIARAWAQKLSTTLEYTHALLNAFYNGITHKE